MAKVKLDVLFKSDPIRELTALLHDQRKPESHKDHMLFSQFPVSVRTWSELTGDDGSVLPVDCDGNDTGCSCSASCLACKREPCIEDESDNVIMSLRNEIEKRNNEIVRLYNSGHTDTKELALTFNVTVRTIQRTLKDGKRNDN